MMLCNKMVIWISALENTVLTTSYSGIKSLIFLLNKACSIEWAWSLNGMSVINGVSYKKCNHNLFNNHTNTRKFSPPMYDSWLTHTLRWSVYSTCIQITHVYMFISRVKYSVVEFATGDTRTHKLYKGARHASGRTFVNISVSQPKNRWPPFGLIDNQYLG